MNWFKQLFKKLTPCNHEWSHLQTNRMFADSDSVRPYGTKYVYICQHCKKLKIVQDY